MERRQQLSPPAGNRGGRFFALDECLRVHHKLTATQRWPNQGSVAIEQSVLGSPQKLRRSLQKAKCAFGILYGIDDAYTVPPGRAVGFQHCGKSVAGIPISEIVQVADDFRFGNPNALFFR